MANETFNFESINFTYNHECLSKQAKFCNCDSESCRCGESNVHEWSWDDENISSTAVLSEDRLEVKLHNGYSYGTTAVRGEKVLEEGRYHYWEIKMLSPIYGTDTMIGVGTSKLDLNSTKNVFCSLLGNDHESLGYSYKGYIQFCGRKRQYGPGFVQGSIVGVHVNTWKGTIEFFLNRKPLGIAFSGLRNLALYPMASSTAAQSKMRLIHSSSLPVSLQVECLTVLKPAHRAYLSIMFPGLRHLTDSTFAHVLKKSMCNNDNESDDESDDANENGYVEYLRHCVILDDFDFALVGAGGQKRTKKKSSCDKVQCKKGRTWDCGTFDT